jgi:photosystem II stability/assembly factor-like uncharacterized protein
MKFRITGICIALLLLFTSSAFAQWQLQYEVQQNYSFLAVHFGSPTVGYIVGSGGVIFKTIDAGLTWTQMTSPTTNTLNDVYFTSATDGWAVGSTGTILHTTDGTNWNIVATAGLTVSLYGVWCSGSTVWVGGGADNVACTIRFSSDGGATWNAPTTNPSTDMCTDISFADALNGCAAVDAGAGTGNSLMYTTDGGVNWTLSACNYGAYPYTRRDIEAVRAVSASTYIATGWGSTVGGQPTIILISTNGGANFNAPDPSYAWNTYSYGYNVAVFTGGDALIVGGGTQLAGFSIRGFAPGFTTWTRQPAFYGEALNDVCAIPGTQNIVAVGDAGLIAYSMNYAASWAFAYDAGMPYQGVQDFVSLGKNRVLAAGAGAAILDFDLAAGRHYYRVASPNNWGPSTVGDFDYIADPNDPSDAVVYLSGATKYLVKSYDEGKTWTELQHTNALQDGLLGMYWFHPDTAIIVGHKLSGTSSRDETIWKTVDGGVTLTEVLMGTIPGTVSREWKAVDFAPTNRNIGAVVGTYNKARYTTDGGVTWPLATENIADTTIALQAVAMIDATTGFAVGDKGTLVKTTNGGASWTMQAVPWGTANLLDIETSTPTRLWVSGENQICYYSTDGGATWTSINVTSIPTADDVMAVFFHGQSGLLWAGCHYSRVFNRSDAAATDADAPKLPFALNQNYPNPFNPSTRIDFAVDIDGRVTLNVYDVSGRLVATVMDENLKAGAYNVTFNADKLATGVYFYKLSTSAGDITRKMVVVR